MTTVTVGVAVGAGEGCEVGGDEVGGTEGRKVDGEKVGERTACGLLVGRLVGLFVGDLDGLCVGFWLGDEGELVGEAVGSLVL
eukprot:CAMPEP_0197052938 /NCGR_PEP_ID=MMETSP1384-20130603/27326_1 /TAXON_ID=29189 /ORGANISM="Ammonia sp." /LENGTH=82 /DNA_ID=CAMNT_0042485761 /DNA_START=335 /DNA_END=583 /DNA_ORIENTATION=-